MTTPSTPTESLARLQGWLDVGTDAALARIIAMEGFGGRRSGELLAVRIDPVASDRCEWVGQLALGAATQRSVDAARVLLSDPARLAVSVTVPVGDDEAVQAGLACGGTAEVLIQAASTLPSQFLAAVRAGEEVVLATDTDTGTTWSVTRTEAHGPGDLNDDVRNAAQRLLNKGPAAATMLTVDEGRYTQAQIWLEPFIPAPRLVVLGEAALADALVRQVAVLGWSSVVLAEQQIDETVQAVATLGPVDGVVVLSHDLAASTLTLATALLGRCGYVGALGSRHTQTARAALLTSQHQIGAKDLQRVHGPVGLDLGSRTPEETALAIVAEMLAVTRQRVAQSLTQSTGPING
jgi:xanthine dehydrogenase accessory factor